MRWRVLAVTQLAGFMSLLDVSIVNVALPSIERGLHASAQSAQWVVSGYALAFGLALVPAGRLGDTFGRRRMFLISLSAFIVTSALSGAAPSPMLLVFARLLQGIAGGVLTPQNSGLIQDLFRGAERGRAFGIFGATIGLSTAVGPVVGGLILAAFTGPDGWRYVFYVNLPIGLFALALAYRLVPATAGGGSRGADLDLVGTVLLGGGVLSLLLPLVEAQTGGLDRWRPLFLLAAALLAGFAWWELRTARRGRQPLLEPDLTRTPGYPAGLGIGLVYFIGFTGIWLVLALFFQNGLGYSPLRSGLAVTPFAIGVAVSAVIAGRVVSRGRTLADGCRAGGGRCRADRRRAGAADRQRRCGGLRDRRAPADRRPWRRHGGLAQHHPDAGLGAGADGRRGRWRAADGPADRLGDRHGDPRRRLLRGAAAHRRQPVRGDHRCPADRRRGDGARAAAVGRRPGPCSRPRRAGHAHAAAGAPHPQPLRCVG
jgi:MFS family permease